MLNLKLEVFEGPFDLLYKLIEKHKIDIYDIPISLIAEKYVEEVEAMEKKDIDNIGEFLIMAATLLRIKSKMLLPNEDEESEEEEDPRLELVKRLIEYKKYKEAADSLRQMSDEASGILFKPNNNLLDEFKNTLDVDSFLNGVDLDILTNAFLKLVKTEKKVKDDTEVKEHISNTVRRKNVYTIEKQMESLLDRIRISDKMNFAELFNPESEKMEKVVTFLALLELMKLKAICVKQEGTFGDIIIQRLNTENLEGENDEAKRDI